MSDAIPPIPYRWTGESHVPLNAHWQRRADDLLVIGETYVLVPHEDRSDKSHNHYFAQLGEAWQQLPESLSERFATVEHLRKYALIRAGYRDERSIVCRSVAEARRIAAFIRPMDDFAVVVVRGATVHVATAKSQSRKAMGATAFQASKDAVLAYVWELVGVTPAVGSENTARAA